MADRNNRNSNERNASSQRRRQLISINNQIDRIQDVYFRNYTQNINRRISSLAERQSAMLGQLYDTIDAEERNRLRRSFADRQEALRQSLADWRSYNQQIRGDLTLADRFASNVFYWNRRRDLRDLEREARYRFDDIRDEAEELSEDMSSMFSSVTDSLRDWANALNLNQIASGMEDTQKSMRDSRLEMQKQINLSEEEWRILRNQANEYSKMSGYAISNTEYMERFSDIISVYDDKEFASKVVGSLAKANYFGLDAQSLDGLFEISKGNADYVNNTISQMMRIQQADGLFTKATDLATAIDESKSFIQQITSDPDKQAEMFNQMMALRTASNASWLDGIDSKLMEIASTPLSEMSTDMLMLGGQEIQNLMLSGNSKEAAQLYTSNLNSFLNKKFSSEAARVQYLNSLGLTDKEFQAKIMQGDNISDFFKAYDEAMAIIDEEATAATKFVDTWDNTGVTSFEKIGNQFKTSSIGEFLDDVSNELDLTLTEAMLLGSGALKVGKSLTGGLKKLFGSRGATGATGARSILGFSSGGAGVINHRLLGSTGNAMISGTGALGGLSSLGTKLVAAGGGGAVSGSAAALAGGASITGGIIGGASIISGIVDIASANTEKTWQEEADKVTQGAIKIGGTAAAAGVGAAIGSIVPGLGTAVGGLIGAGVGGLATLIWGDDWAQQLTDLMDGTKKIRETLELLDTTQQELTKTMQKTKSYDDLIELYEKQHKELAKLTPGSEEYNKSLSELQGTVSDLNNLLPGVVQTETDGITIKKESLEATERLIEAEKNLARLRSNVAIQEAIDTESTLDDQLSKSKNKANEFAPKLDAYNELNRLTEELQKYQSEFSITNDGFILNDNASADARAAYDEYLSKARNLYKQAGLDSWNDNVDWRLSDSAYTSRVYKNLIDGDKEDLKLVEEMINGYTTAQSDVQAKQLQYDESYTKSIQLMETSLGGPLNDIAARYDEMSSSDQLLFKQYLSKLENLNNTYDNLSDGILVDPAALKELAGIDGSHADGLWRVPNDGYHALLHKDEAVLTADEAETWRQSKSSWTPNDRSKVLSNKDIVVINQASNSESSEEVDDASREEVIETLKWLAKEIKTSIEKNSGNSDSNNNLLKTLLKNKVSKTDLVYSFMKN